MLHDGFYHHSLDTYYFLSTLMTHANYRHYLSSSQKISEDEEHNISMKYTHHRAQKDISELLEQLLSSKYISEAHKVF